MLGDFARVQENQTFMRSRRRKDDIEYLSRTFCIYFRAYITFTMLINREVQKFSRNVKAEKLNLN